MPAAIVLGVAAATGVTAAVGGAIGAAIVGSAVSSVAAAAIGTAVISGGITAIQGGSTSDVLKSAVLGGLSSGIGSTIASSIASDVAFNAIASGTSGQTAVIMGNALGGAAAGAISSGASALLSGQDPVKALIKGGLTAGLSAGVNSAVYEYTKDIDFLSKPTGSAVGDAVQRATKAAIATAILGGSGSDAFTQSALTSFATIGVNYIKDGIKDLSAELEKRASTARFVQNTLDGLVNANKTYTENYNQMAGEFTSKYDAAIKAKDEYETVLDIYQSQSDYSDYMLKRMGYNSRAELRNDLDSKFAVANQTAEAYNQYYNSNISQLNFYKRKADETAASYQKYYDTTYKTHTEALQDAVEEFRAQETKNATLALKGIEDVATAKALYKESTGRDITDEELAKYAKDGDLVGSVDKAFTTEQEARAFWKATFGEEPNERQLGDMVGFSEQDVARHIYDVDKTDAEELGRMLGTSNLPLTEAQRNSLLGMNEMQAQAKVSQLRQAANVLERQGGTLNQNTFDYLFNSQNAVADANALYTTESEARDLWRQIVGTNPREDELMDLIGLSESQVKSQVGDIAYDRKNVSSDELDQFLKDYGKGQISLTTDEKVDLLGRSEADVKTQITSKYNEFVADKKSTDGQEAVALWKKAGLSESDLTQDQLKMMTRGSEAAAETYAQNLADIKSVTFEGDPSMNQAATEAAAKASGYNNYTYNGKTYLVNNRNLAAAFDGRLQQETANLIQRVVEANGLSMADLSQDQIAQIREGVHAVYGNDVSQIKAASAQDFLNNNARSLQEVRDAQAAGPFRVDIRGTAIVSENRGDLSQKALDEINSFAGLRLATAKEAFENSGASQIVLSDGSIAYVINDKDAGGLKGVFDDLDLARLQQNLSPEDPRSADPLLYLQTVSKLDPRTSGVGESIINTSKYLVDFINSSKLTSGQKQGLIDSVSVTLQGTGELVKIFSDAAFATGLVSRDNAAAQAAKMVSQYGSSIQSASTKQQEDNIYKAIKDAKGVWGTLGATVKAIAENPAGALTMIGKEGVQELPMMLASGGMGRLALGIASKGLGFAAATGTNAFLNGAESFGANFGETYDNIRKQGGSHDQAMTQGWKAGTQAALASGLLAGVADASLVKTFMGDVGKITAPQFAGMAAKQYAEGWGSEFVENASMQYNSFGKVDWEQSRNAGAIGGILEMGVASGLMAPDAISQNLPVARDVNGNVVTLSEFMSGSKQIQPGSFNMDSVTVPVGDAQVSLSDLNKVADFATANPNFNLESYKTNLESLTDAGYADPNIGSVALTVTTAPNASSLVNSLTNMGLDSQDLSSVVNTRFDKQYVSVDEVKEAAKAQGYTISDAEAANFIGLRGEDATLKAVEQYSDPRQVIESEAREAFARAGYSPTDAEVAQFVGQRAEQQALKGIESYVDPRSVTTDEAKQFFADLGYTPSDAEVAQFVKQANEGNVKSAVATYVNPRQMTTQEATDLFGKLGYKATPEEVAQFVRQGSQLETDRALRAYVDPRMASVAEVKAAAAAEGITLTNAQAAQFVGQRDEAKALEEARAFADPLFVLDAEARAEFERSGYPATAEEVSKFVGRRSETAALDAIKEYIDPRQVTSAEAKQFFDSLGYPATEQEIAQFTKIADQAGVQEAVRQYVDPRQVTSDEAAAAFKALGYEAKPEELAQFTKQGEGISQQDVLSGVTGYVDPRFADIEEIKAAAREEGYELSDEEAARFVGQRDEALAREEARKYADPLQVLDAEARAEFERLGYPATAEDVAKFVGQRSEQEAYTAIKSYVDPLQVTREEVKSRFESLGYTPKPAEIEAYIRQGAGVDQNLVMDELAQYVDPRLMSKDEVQDAFRSLGYNFTEDEVNQFIRQGTATAERVQNQNLRQYVDPRMADIREVREAAQAEGFRLSDEEAAKFIGQRDEAEALAAARSYADPLFVLDAEARAEFERLGYPATPEEVARFVGKKAEAEALGAIGSYVDPRQVTADEAKKFFADLGYPASDAEVAQFVKIADQAGVQAAVGQYVDPRQVSQSEVEGAFRNLGYTFTPEELQQFVRQGQDINQEGVLSDLSSYVDPRMISSEEAAEAYRALGYENPTQEDLQRLMGQYGEEGLTAKAQQAFNVIQFNRIGDFETKLTQAINDAKQAGLDGDAALQSAIDAVASDLGTTKTDLLTQIGKTEESLRQDFATQISGVETQIGDVQSALEKAIADAKAAGLEGDAALQQAIDAVASDLGTTRTDLLTQIGKSEESLKTDFATQLGELKEDVGTQIGDVQTALSKAIQDAIAAGQSGDAALQTAIDAVATNLGTTKDDLLSQLGTTETALRTDFATQLGGLKEDIGTQIGGVQSALEKAIQDAITAGQSGDAALQTAIDSVATNLGTTRTDILEQIGKSESDLRTEFGEQLGTVTESVKDLDTQLNERIDELVEQGKTQSEATNQALQEIIDQQKTQTETTEQLETRVDTGFQDIDTRIGELMSQGKTYQEATNLAIGEMGGQLSSLKEAQAAEDAARKQEAAKQQSSSLMSRAAGFVGGLGGLGLLGQQAAAPDEKAQFIKPFFTGKEQEKFESPLEKYLKTVRQTQYVQPEQEEPQQQDRLDQQDELQEQNMPQNYFNYGQSSDVEEMFPQQDGGFLGFRDGGLVPPLMAMGGTVFHSGKYRTDYRKGSAVTGPGDGQSDDIPAMLADGEYVIDAEIVAALGNGSTKAGSKILDDMRKAIRAHKRSGPLGIIPPKAKSPLQYIAEGQKMRKSKSQARSQ